MWQANELTSCVPYFIHVTWIRSTSESICTFIIYNRYNTALPTYELWRDTLFLRVFVLNRYYMGPLAFIHVHHYVECTVQIVCGKVPPLSNCKHHFNRAHTKSRGKTARTMGSFSTGGREGWPWHRADQDKNLIPAGNRTPDIQQKKIYLTR